VFFHAINTATVPNVTGHHFLTFFTKLFFDNNEFFSVMHSCCCLTGLGLGLNLLVFFQSLTMILWMAPSIVQICLRSPSNWFQEIAPLHPASRYYLVGPIGAVDSFLLCRTSGTELVNSIQYSPPPPPRFPATESWHAVSAHAFVRSMFANIIVRYRSIVAMVTPAFCCWSWVY